MGVKINGTKDPVEQGRDVTYDPGKGITTAIRYEAAGDNLNLLANGYYLQRLPYNLSRNGFKSSLVASVADNASEDTWEILADENQKDVYQHPMSIAMEEAHPKILGKIQANVNLIMTGREPKPASDYGGALAMGALALERLLVSGTTAYAHTAYVLKHTTSVWSGYAVNVSDQNIEKIYTPTELLAEVTNRSLWVFPLPPRLVFKIHTLEAPPARTGYLWGWRKTASSETSAARNRINITTQYVLEQWSLYLYKTVTIPPI